MTESANNQPSFPNDQILLNYDILSQGGSYTVKANPFGLGYTVTVTDAQYPIQVLPYVFQFEGSGLQTGTFAVGQGPLHFSRDHINPFDPQFDGTLVTATCFVAGTHIATEAGEVPVESIVEGDLVTVMKNGAPVSLPVKWVGCGAMDASEFGHRDEAFPVRIRAGAFSEGVPHRDLVVTPEHCILVEGKLIPARMLVNGGSIIVDREMPTYRYFHVELEAHGILIAEGLATESYINTGNRSMFSGLTEEAPAPAIALAAPLVVDRATVEPIWMALNARAAEIGSRAIASSSTLTDDPALRLLLDDGTELAARWHRGARRMFHIPRGAKPMRLLSRAASPAEIDGPFVDDRRRLGVSVGKMVVWTGLSDTEIGVTSLGLEGWHAPEQGVRWTDGSAALDIPAADNDETFVAVDIAATMRYRDEAVAKAA